MHNATINIVAILTVKKPVLHFKNIAQRPFAEIVCSRLIFAVKKEIKQNAEQCIYA
jgi:hypothetical protein